MARVTIDVEKIETVAADDRGRVYLGSKYAEEDVEVAVIGVVDQESKAEVEADSEAESGDEADSIWTPRERRKGNDGIPEDEKGDVPAERPGCPECGSENLGVEDMAPHGAAIYCADCGCTLQVG